MGSDRSSAAGCVVWCGLVAGGAAAGVLLALAAELAWPTRVADGGPLAGAGLVGAVLERAALAGLVGAVIGGLSRDGQWGDSGEVAGPNQALHLAGGACRLSQVHSSRPPPASELGRSAHERACHERGPGTDGRRAGHARPARRVLGGTNAGPAGHLLGSAPGPRLTAQAGAIPRRPGVRTRRRDAPPLGVPVVGRGRSSTSI